MRFPYRFAVRAAVVTCICAVAACTDDSPTGSGTPVETNQVSVRDDFFAPASNVVDQGTTVTWTWLGSNQHNVTWNESNPPNSPTQASGTFSRTFSTAGEFSYFCSIHVGMTGLVTVR